MNYYKIIGNPTEAIIAVQSEKHARQIFKDRYPGIPILGVDRIEWTFEDPMIEFQVDALVALDFRNNQNKSKEKE